MKAQAVVIQSPKSVAIQSLALTPATAQDVIVEIEWNGISTGTERLLWSGDMPEFPGMGYPLVPGYESVGRVTQAGSESGRQVGERVFVPGAACFAPVKSLFGGTASKLVVPGARVTPVDEALEDRALLLALAATAYHAMRDQAQLPELIVGHGVLGRLLARATVALGAPAPVVWEINPARRDGGVGYPVIDPADDDRHDYQAVYDVSGSATIVDQLVSRMSRGGEIVLAGFYPGRFGFDFAAAFMREIRLRIAAEWEPQDLEEVNALVTDGRLSLHGLVSHCEPAGNAEVAYEQAFNDSECLKMSLDWRAS